MTPDTINDWVTAIMKLSAAPFTVVAVIALGYFFRAIPKFNNEWLWLVCGAGGMIIFPVLGHRHADDTATVFFTRSIIMGLILGMGSWAIHDKLLKQIEDKIPGLSSLATFVDKVGGKAAETDGTTAGSKDKAVNHE